MATDAPQGGAKRLAVIGPSALALTRLRGPLIKAALARGVRVLALAPDVTAGDAQALIQMGAEVQSFPPDPGGFPLLRQRRRIANLSQQIKDFHPETALVFGANITPLAVAALQHARVPQVSVLFNEMPEGGIPARLTAALKSANTVIAHNHDDARALERTLSGSSVKVLRVPGMGSDLATVTGVAMPAATEPVIFLAAARLDRVKGIHAYLEAARLAQQAGLPARFLLAGGNGVAAGAVTPELLARYQGAVEYLGDVADPAAAISAAHVIVSPSQREGMPVSLLQALASGRAIIASDIPGARETVDEMVNGTLVPQGDPKALADAFQRMVRNRALLTTMGRASRAKAERGFSSVDVHARLFAALGIA